VSEKLKHFLEKLKQLLYVYMNTTTNQASNQPTKSKMPNYGYHASVEIKQAEDYANCIIVEWDHENPKVNKLMSYEHRHNIGDKKKNLMWLDKVKEVAKWKVGETIFINQKSFTGCFEAYWSKDKTSCFNDIIIEPTGYVCMRTCNLYTINWSKDDTNERVKNMFYVRVESKYNDIQSKMN